MEQQRLPVGLFKPDGTPCDLLQEYNKERHARVQQSEQIDSLKQVRILRTKRKWHVLVLARTCDVRISFIMEEKVHNM